jgi:hypothetical protein
MYRDTTNVEHEMYVYTSNTWNLQNSNKGVKKNLEATPQKHPIHSLKKMAIRETSHIVQKALQSET